MGRTLDFSEDTEAYPMNVEEKATEAGKFWQLCYIDLCMLNIKCLYK